MVEIKSEHAAVDTLYHVAMTFSISGKSTPTSGHMKPTSNVRMRPHILAPRTPLEKRHKNSSDHNDGRKPLFPPPTPGAVEHGTIINGQPNRSME